MISRTPRPSSAPARSSVPPPLRALPHALLFGIASVSAGCSGDDEPLAPFINGNSEDGGSASLGGAPSAGGAAGAGGLGGAGGDPFGDFPQPEKPPPLTEAMPQCPRGGVLANTTVLTHLSSEADERLLAITPSETSLVFERTAEASTTYFIADRPNVDADFASPLEIEIPVDYDASRGMALSPDGLRLVLLTEGGFQFGEVERPTTEQAFSSTVDQTPFEALNGGFGGFTYRAPLFSPNGKALVYTLLTSGGTSLVAASALRDGEWEVGIDFAPFQTYGTTAEPLDATAISHDLLTVFFWETAAGTTTAGFLGGEFTPGERSTIRDFESLGDRPNAHPSQGCDRIYSTVNGDLVVEDYTPATDDG